MNTNRHKKISVDISIISEQRLEKAIKNSGRTKKDEVRIRLAHSLKYIELVEDNYWDLISS